MARNPERQHVAKASSIISGHIYCVQTKGIDKINRIVPGIGIEIGATKKANEVRLDKPSYRGIVVSRTIKVQTGFRVQLPRRKCIWLDEIRIQLRLNLAERRIRIALNHSAALVGNFC